jgi:hypothetical protein
MLAIPLIKDNPTLDKYMASEVHIYCFPFGLFMIIVHPHSGASKRFVQLHMHNMPSVMFQLDFTGVRLPMIYLLSSFRPIELLGR